LSDVSAVLFARNHEKVARFYQEALGLAQAKSDQDHTVLNCSGFELIVHQIPAEILADCKIEDPCARRNNGAIRLNFPVDSIDKARSAALSLGGQVDAAPPPWAGNDANFFLGVDPEGNVFKISERGR